MSEALKKTTILARAEACPRKYKDKYRIRYICPIDNKKKSIPARVTGDLLSVEAAEEWISEYLDRYLSYELALLERQQWRSHSEWIKLVNNYKTDRKTELKSPGGEFSYLDNYVLPFFLSVEKMLNADEWYKKSWHFQYWLQNECFTAPSLSNPNGSPITRSTSNKVINSYNFFVRWLEKNQYISQENLRILPNIRRKKDEDVLDIEMYYEDEFLAMINSFESLRASNTDDQSNNEHYKTYHDIFYCQYYLGCRTNEMLGLNLSHIEFIDEMPSELSEAYDKANLKVFGLIVLNAQPRDDYLKREGKNLPYKSLKWRRTTGPRDSRIIPITDNKCWSILVTRAKAQQELFEKGIWGSGTDESITNYLLFSTRNGQFLPQRAKYLEVLKRVFKNTNLSKFKHPHCLRHTRSTELVLKLPTKIYELVLGHKLQASEQYHHIATKMLRKMKNKSKLSKLKNINTN